MLETLIFEAEKKVQNVMILLHGLGADGHDFEPVVRRLSSNSLSSTRFILPHAPKRPVTVNNGLIMRAWYDAYGSSNPPVFDHGGMLAAEKEVVSLISNQLQEGIPASKIVLAGFSQGGVIALLAGFGFSQKLGGIVALSSGLPSPELLTPRMMGINRTTPLFLSHGTREPGLPEAARNQIMAQMRAMGSPIIWNTYERGHSVCPGEIDDLEQWLLRIFGDK